jgi:hypothetical protein
MMNIDKIITESINKVITEGYSGKYAEDWINKELIPKIGRWLKKVKANKLDADRSFSSFVYTNGLWFDKKCSMIMRGKNTYIVTVKLNYFPDKIFNNGVGGVTHTPQDLNDRNIEILFNVNKEAGLPSIYRALLHEFTHVVDFITGRKKGNDGYFGYNHQIEGDSSLPDCIVWLLYFLWDTSEFNAWQANVNSDTDLFNQHFEQIMKYLNKANEINDEKTWNNVREYLAGKMGSKMKNATTAWIKKYWERYTC